MVRRNRQWGLPSLFAACALGALVTILSSGFCAAASAIDDIYVSPPPSGNDTNPGTQSAPFATIQRAINVAANGATIWVSAGTYTGGGNRDINFNGKAVSVRSMNGPEVTIIDCQGTSTDRHRGFYFHSSETSTSVVDGFTIRNGYGPNEDLTDPPVGMAWSSGGGIFCTQSSPLIINNIISGNTAQYGAGIQCWKNSSPTIRNNAIRNNTASDQGGGIYLYNNCSSTIDGNVITDNNTVLGGGVAIDMFSQVVLTNNLIVRNSASNKGGGLYCGNSSPTLTNNTIAQNDSESYGGAYFWYSAPAIANCILWNNIGGEIGYEGGNVSVSYSDITGGYPGPSNIDLNPLFAGPTDFHLGADSPCIDSGDNSATGFSSKDIEGNPSIFNGIVDMGAYEYGFASPCAGLGGDSDGDGICDDGDGSGTVGDDPCTGGNTIDCDDNCRWDMNPDQADFNANGVGDLCDPQAMGETPEQQPDGNVVVAYSPDGEKYLDVTVTLKYIPGLLLTLDGVTGTPYIRPTEYNVIPQIMGGDIPADTIHCGPPCSIPEDIVLVTQAEGSRDFNVRFPLSRWWTGLLPGTYTAPVRYVNYCKELRPYEAPIQGLTFQVTDVGDYPGIYQGEVDLGSTRVDVALNPGDQCPDMAGDAGGTGCPFADYNRVIMHEVNIGRRISCDKHPLSGASVRVYDRNKPFFKKNFGSKALISLWYGTIFESVLTPEQGMIGSCITNDSGECYVGEKKKGSYLVIVRYQDSQTRKTVYTGGTKGLWNFSSKTGLAKLEFNLIKVTSKFGTIEFRGATRTLFSGHMLEVLSPESAIWEGTRSVYPFIFTSWRGCGVDVCAEVPSGYRILGVYDADGNLAPSGKCVQTFVKGETKAIAFEVQGSGSQGPSLNATLTLRNPEGKKAVQKMETQDFWKKSFVGEVAKAKALTKKNRKWRSKDH